MLLTRRKERKPTKKEKKMYGEHYREGDYIVATDRAGNLAGRMGVVLRTEYGFTFPIVARIAGVKVKHLYFKTSEVRLASTLEAAEYLLTN